MAIGFGLKILPNTPIGRRLFLKGPDASEVAHGTLPEDLKELVGHTGLALTDLRPAGTARIAGRRVDVIADGRFVERGGGVRVLGVNGTRVVVQAT
jgi:membrane-bound serine protease (ClpP class)